MRTIDEYMKLPYRMEIVEDISEGGYVVSYPDLNGCITCADTIEAAIANAKDAKLAWLEAAVVPNLKYYLGAVGVELDLDFSALRRELDRVVDQVDPHLV